MLVARDDGTCSREEVVRMVAENSGRGRAYSVCGFGVFRSVRVMHGVLYVSFGDVVMFPCG